jgi:hypothetical protein
LKTSSSLIVEFVLEVTSNRIFFLPETRIPVFINTTREHESDLRNICHEIFLTLDDADNVAITALTESKIAWVLSLIVLIHVRLLLFPEFKLKFNKLSVIGAIGTCTALKVASFYFRESFRNLYSLKRTENACSMMELRGHKFECFQRS